jgi:hypothetical protein
MGNISANALLGICNEDTFDIVLGSDGNCTVLNSGTHWDCWMPVTLVPTAMCRKRNVPDHMKLGKHLGLFSWREHILWLNLDDSSAINNN